MSKRLLFIGVMVTFLGSSEATKADLITIGTATYKGADYNLIYDEEISAVWFDYSNHIANWSTQNAWATSLGSHLTYNLDNAWDATHDLTWADTTWRLPTTVDGTYVYGWEGDPDNDGEFNYTVGYNLENSEMGHLYYGDDALNNTGYRYTDGTWNTTPPNAQLENKGDFQNLKAFSYWSNTEFADNTDKAWLFLMNCGHQLVGSKYEIGIGYGLAVRNVHVLATDPVPEPTTILLFGTGLAGLAGYRRKLQK